MNTRPHVITHWLDHLAHQLPSIRALEVGRIRSVTETRGHSTKHIACHPAVATLVSIDASPATRGPTLEIVPIEHHHKIELVDADAITWLESTNDREFDFAYLDGRNDAKFCLDLLLLAVRVVTSGAIIIQDDTDGPAGVVKGREIKPYVSEHPDVFKVLEDVPRDATCHGLLVMQVEGCK